MGTELIGAKMCLQGKERLIVDFLSKDRSTSVRSLFDDSESISLVTPDRQTHGTVEKEQGLGLEIRSWAIFGSDVVLGPRDRTGQCLLLCSSGCSPRTLYVSPLTL
jgi:hypothetical protein